MTTHIFRIPRSSHGSRASRKAAASTCAVSTSTSSRNSIRTTALSSFSKVRELSVRCNRYGSESPYHLVIYSDELGALVPWGQTMATMHTRLSWWLSIESSSVIRNGLAGSISCGSVQQRTQMSSCCKDVLDQNLLRALWLCQTTIHSSR